MAEHKYAHVLRWIADGEKVQYWDLLVSKWDLLSNNTTVLCNAYLGMDFEFRLAPALITINGVEIEAPFAPARGDQIWCFNMLGMVSMFLFNPDIPEHQKNAAAGNCYRSKEAAAAAFSAVTKALTQKAG